MNRNEFMQYAEEELKDLSGNVMGALLYTEKAKGSEHEYFVVSKNVSGAENFWDWCTTNLSAPPICYYMNHEANEEWWGFADKKDAFIWMTRWV